MTDLLLSLFPGIGLLDSAFEAEGFCVVRGPDVLWGGDVRRFHPPAGRFDGLIAGPPCQCFSSLANIVRHNGHQPKFGNLIPEFERCVAEAQPRWFVMEEVPRAPSPCVDGYGVHSFILNNRQLGESQNRKRRISFGSRGDRRVLQIDVVAIESPVFAYAATGGHAGTLALVDRRRVGKANSVREYRRGTSCLGGNSKTAWAFEELKRLQGLPAEFDLPPFTVAAKCQAVGNGVPIAMGRAIARAVREMTATT
ncbi:MAG: DNA cytosine methyltransferase [Acidobacteria bacterium]|nr:DNA cytosine methyltransferase [Acidobacteriota bacterium]